MTDKQYLTNYETKYINIFKILQCQEMDFLIQISTIHENYAVRPCILFFFFLITTNLEENVGFRKGFLKITKNRKNTFQHFWNKNMLISHYFLAKKNIKLKILQRKK